MTDFVRTRIGRLLALSLFSLQLQAYDANAADPGSVGFNFLKISVSARNAAMADVGVSLTNSLLGVYYNPASIEATRYPTVGFVHQEGIFDTRREFLGAAAPLFGGVLSVGFDYFKISDLEARTGPTESPVGYFDSQDILTFVAYAFRPATGLSLGVTAKYAAEKIEAQTADAVLFDLGMQFVPTDYVTAGLAVRHFGSKPKFYREEIELPVTVAGGLSASVRGTTLAIEAGFPKGSDTRFNIGGERIIADIIAFRAGYKFGYDEENLAFGVGFMQSIWHVDYAFVPYQSGLGNAHRFALTVEIR